MPALHPLIIGLLLTGHSLAIAQANPWGTPAPTAAPSSAQPATLPPPIPSPSSPPPNTPAARMNASPQGTVPVTNLNPQEPQHLPPGAVPIAPNPQTPSVLGNIMNQATKALDPNTEIEEVQSIFVGIVNGKRVYLTEVGPVYRKPSKDKKYEMQLVKPIPPSASASASAAPNGTLFPSQKPPPNLPNSVGGVPINR